MYQVNERVALAEKMGIEIQIACNRYIPVAVRGSILYFVIADLALIDPMYQFSLFYFLGLFGRSIDNAEQTDDLIERLMILSNDITLNTFTNVCRGLFEKHKMIFSFMITSQILMRQGGLLSEEFNLLLRGIGMLDLSEMPPNPNPDGIPEKQWQLLYGIEHVSPRCKGGGLCASIAELPEAWEEWWSMEHPELTPLPGEFEELHDLTYFHKLLVVKALAPEKVFFMVTEFVRRVLGEVYVIFPAATMEEIYADLTEKIPGIFILSTGADPTAMLYRFAVSVGFSDKLDMISLGQGQGPKAAKLIEHGMKEGTWVVLQNCHLCQSWMPVLERTVEAFEDNKHINKAFRLFLTSMPAPYFPVPVLQNGVKLTTEPPNGIRANLKRSLLPKSDESLESCSQPAEWRTLQLSLMFFHSIVQERRKFGPLGWNIRYEFNDSDLETSTTITKNMLDIDGDIPWDTLLFVIGHINYGGRVTDDKDRRCILAILEQYVSPQLLDPSYEFSNSGNYKCPPNSDTATTEGFIEFVKSFPLTEAPEVFGMHDNANISFMQQESDKLIGVVLSIQPRESGSGGGKSSEEIVVEIAADQSSRLPEELTQQTAHATTFTISEETGLMNSLGTCLVQEMQRFNLLLKKLKSTLRDLQKAVKGTIVMTADLDEMFTSFLNNVQPGIWNSANYLSLKPLASWYEDLILRVEFFREWVENGVPNAFWISSFFFPQGFLTAVLQSYSRGNTIPVDQLSFEFNVEDTDG